jgi:hypothetical protein
LFNEGVGREASEVKFFRMGNTVATSSFSAGRPIQESFSARIVTLDEAIKRSEGLPVRLVKINAEGAEVGILEGASREALREVNQFVIEYHDIFVPGALHSCKTILHDHGYNCIVRPHVQGQGLLYAVRDKT